MSIVWEMHFCPTWVCPDCDPSKEGIRFYIGTTKMKSICFHSIAIIKGGQPLVQLLKSTHPIVSALSEQTHPVQLWPKLSLCPQNQVSRLCPPRDLEGSS